MDAIITKNPPEKSKTKEILRKRVVLAGRTTGAGINIINRSVMIFLDIWSVHIHYRLEHLKFCHYRDRSLVECVEDMLGCENACPGEASESRT